MRTTLHLDDDILQAAKEIAESRKTTAGKIVSELVRKALKTSGPSVKRGSATASRCCRRGPRARPGRR